MERKKIRFFIVLSLGQNEDCSFRYGVRRGICGFFLGAVRDDVRRGIIGFLDGSASLGFKGRAVLQLKNGATPAQPFRFRQDERRIESTSRGLCSCS